MTHRAEQIMAAVVVALTGLTTTGANVFRGRVYDVQSGEMPALLVFQGGDEIVSDLLHDFVVSELTVYVDARVREAVDNVNTALNAINEEVTVALAADHTLGLTFVHAAMFKNSEEPEIDAGDKPTALMRMVWLVTYQRSRTNPAI